MLNFIIAKIFKMSIKNLIIFIKILDSAQKYDMKNIIYHPFGGKIMRGDSGIGRPTKFKPSMITKVVKLRKAGFSLCSIALELDLDASTLYDWMSDPEHPFSHAIRQTEPAYRGWWERLGYEKMQGDAKNFHAVGYIHQMRNRFRNEWNDAKYRPRELNDFGKTGGSQKDKIDDMLRKGEIDVEEWRLYMDGIEKGQKIEEVRKLREDVDEIQDILENKTIGKKIFSKMKKNVGKKKCR